MRSWFREQLAMYAAYHRDRRNRATHVVGVPLIVFAIMVAAAQAGLAWPLVLLALVFYVAADTVLGLALAPVLALMCAGAVMVPDETAWLIFAGCFIGGWLIQFVGHGFEGRKPALLDNLVQALMAPPFLIAEALFALGLRRDLSADLDARHQKYLPGV